MDVDMVIDATLVLWTKCKAVFQRNQTGAPDNFKYLAKIENASQVGFILHIKYSIFKLYTKVNTVFFLKNAL